MDALMWSILLLLLGLGLIALEVFVPSGGVLGVLAALALIASIAVAFSDGWATGTAMLVVSMFVVPLAIAVAIHYWPRTPIGRMLVLEPQSEDEVLPDTAEQRRLLELIGQHGVAKTKMLPSGAVVIGGKSYDAFSEGLAIEAGQPVRVAAIRAHRVVIVPDDTPAAVANGGEDLTQPARSLGLESLDDSLA